MSPYPVSLLRVAAGLLLGLTTLHSEVIPAALFCDHAVLQQGLPLPVWGTAAEGENVTVEFAGQKSQAVAHEGRWMVRLKPVTAGGPYTMVITGSNRIVLTDILVGEVWVCSGQSNMEMKLGPTEGYQAVVNWQEAVATAGMPMLRNFTVPRTHSLAPLSQTTATWEVCSPATAPKFSAVAFFFGRALLQSRHVPIGLIHSSWGGSFAQAWMSGEWLRKQPDFADALAEQALYLKNPAGAAELGVRLLADWYTKNDPGSSPAHSWSDLPSTPAEWRPIVLPGYWENAGLPDFDGIVWLRREFDLPASWEGHAAELHLGAIDDEDTTWVNGQKVGGLRTYNALRVYPVPATALHAGRNVVTVRVLDTGGNGGFWNVSDTMRLVRLDDPSGPTIDLRGSWHYQPSVAIDALPRPPEQIGKSVATPGALYNGMISPLLPYAIRGVIWYQGESDSGSARRYRSLFPSLISDWRRVWGQGDFPFLFVQIAPWRGMVPEIREAQLLTSQKVPNTAMAVTVDVGDAQDIHAPHKQPVGERLALAARALAYGEQIEYQGPVLESAEYKDGRAILHFRHLRGGLVATGDELRGFVIAGADKAFVPAKATIVGDCIEVSAESVKTPVAVRYAWANLPNGNLWNGAGLPASPFRTDVD